MALDVYWIALIALAPTSVLLAGRSYLVRPFQRLTRGNEGDKQDRDDGDDSAHQFRRTFLQVYLLVMGSEWLQVKGPLARWNPQRFADPRPGPLHVQPPPRREISI